MPVLFCFRMEKLLGKIESVSVGLGGYQGSMLGLHLTFSSRTGGWGVGSSRAAWGPDVRWSPQCKWTETGRSAEYAEIMRFIGSLLIDAKVDNVNDLVGVPVECTFENGSLKEWRILTEVI